MTTPPLTPEQEIARLTREIAAVKYALGTLIAWLPQSANSPIRQDEASQLLAMLGSFDDKP